MPPMPGMAAWPIWLMSCGGGWSGALDGAGAAAPCSCPGISGMSWAKAAAGASTAAAVARRRRRIGAPVGVGTRGSASHREHPDGHGHHHEVFGQRHEAERHIAGPADTGALQLALVDVDRLEDRDRPDRAD